LEFANGLLRTLESSGLLLLQDKTFPNVVTIVTGESVKGSWWAHPLGHQVFRAVNVLAARPDVVVTKLLGGKVTFVHKRLWPALLAVASAREPWQTAGLSPEAEALLEQVLREGGLVSSGQASREIESRLLLRGEQIHTELGHHETRLEAWNSWALRSGCKACGTAAQGRALLEQVVHDLGGSAENLPWHRFPVTMTRRATTRKRKPLQP
jgi:hypothetical protein